MRLVFRLILVAAAVGLLSDQLPAQPPRMGAETNVKDGLSINEPGALNGYTLIFPLNSTSTYLVDMESRVVKEWKSEYRPALSAYLLPNGQLLRPGAESGFGPGSGGRLQKFDWDGELVWDFSIRSLGRDLQPHHDIQPMPNGNVLVIAHETKSQEDAEAVGRPTGGGSIQSDCILEIKPTGKESGEVVWEWHAWDHLIQDVNRERPGYGDVSDHPELIDVNFGNDAFQRMLQDPEALARLRSLGYVGGGAPRPGNDRAGDRPADGNAGPGPQDGDRGRGGRGRGGPGGGPGGGADWLHVNAVAYNANLDQIMISVHGFSEIWIIDHSTTTEEAASHSGGKHGKGGDLLYRWGNPQAYRNGSNVDRRLYQQHDAQWIPDGLPGAGNVLVFNNGGERPDGSYSSVDEIVLPVKEDGSYEREEYVAFGPDRPIWSYTAEDKATFFSHFISGAQRLANGNTLICSGAQGIVFEVTPDNKTVWQYKYPGGEGGPGRGGPGGFGGFQMPRPGEVLPEFLQGMLQLSDEQKESIAALQKEVDAKLEEVLTDAQRAQLAEMRDAGNRAFGRGGPPGFGPPGFGPPGGLNPGDFARDRGPDGFPPGRDGGPGRFRDGGGRDGGRGGPGGGPGGGGPGGGPGGLFRVYRYAADDPALQGKTLTPGEKLETLVATTDRPAPDDRPQRPARPQ